MHRFLLALTVAAIAPAARAVNEAPGPISSTVSGEAGRLTLPQLPIGDYRVEVTFPG